MVASVSPTPEDQGQSGSDSALELSTGESGGSANALGEVIVTAIVTAAVVPFVQTLMQKAAEGTYSGVREWLQGLARKSKPKRVPSEQPQRTLLIVRELDPKLNVWIYVPTDISDEALRNLAQLDVEAEIARVGGEDVAKVRIYLDERAESGGWTVETLGERPKT